MALPINRNAAQAPDFLALIGDDVTREVARQAAAQIGWPSAAVGEGGLVSARALLEAGHPAPGVLLVDVSDAGDVLAAMDRLAEVCEPHTRVVAIGTVNDVALYRALIDLGVSDYLVKPAPAAALAAALRRARDAERPAAPARNAARIVSLIGARGGVGATSVAASLAAGLAQHGLRTVLLDLDLQFGSVALTFDLEPGRGLRELLSNPERIDSMLIGSAAAQASERLRVLAADEPLDKTAEVGAEGVRTLLEALAETADAAVIDVPRRLDAAARAALAGADCVGVVTDLTLAGLRDTARLVQLLAGDGRELLVVGNRAGGAPGELDRAEFERNLGRKLDALVPFDAKAAAAAAGEGRPLLATAGARGAAELKAMVDRLVGAEAAVTAPRSTWMRRLLGSN